MMNDLISRQAAIDAIGDKRMTNSCGNCKYGECREEYFYPYRCKKEKAVSYSEEKWMDRVHHGYICKKWEKKDG